MLSDEVVEAPRGILWLLVQFACFEKFRRCDLTVVTFFSRYVSATSFRVHHLIFFPLREGPHHRQFI